jgi:hypothetical protein
LTNSHLQLSIEYVVIIPIFETIDSICSEIKLRTSDPRGSIITVWVEGLDGAEANELDAGMAPARVRGGSDSSSSGNYTRSFVFVYNGFQGRFAVVS